MLKSVILLFVAVGLGGCAAPQPVALPPSKDAAVLTGKDQRSVVVLKKNGQLTVILQANEAAGYRWRLERPLDGKILAMASASAPLPAIALPPGNSSVRTPPVSKQFVFKAMGPGTTKVRMLYSRLDESLDEASVFEFTVIAE